MHPYTKHLLEDIEKAFRPRNFFQKNKKVPPRDEIEEKLEEVDNFPNYFEAPAFETYCGLKLEDFPPSEKLDEDDIRALTKALIKMYASWNILVDLPENLPADFGYRLAIGLLKRPMPVMKHGFFGMDFCTGNPKGCEFQGYCPCLKQWEGV